jgi:hypothetical protein
MAGPLLQYKLGLRRVVCPGVRIYTSEAYAAFMLIDFLTALDLFEVRFRRSLTC